VITVALIIEILDHLATTSLSPPTYNFLGGRAVITTCDHGEYTYVLSYKKSVPKRTRLETLALFVAELGEPKKKCPRRTTIEYYW